MDIEPPIIEKPARGQVEQPVIHRRRKSLFPSPLLLWAGVGIFALALFKGVDFLVLDKNGKPQLSEKRQKKLDKDPKNFEQAEQYVLLAEEDGWYPCFNCPGSQTIYLLKFQTWKYGVTTLGEKGRYGLGLKSMGLIYLVQLRASLPECLREERRKIISYGMHPENLARDIPLIRPPGNKRDD